MNFHRVMFWAHAPTTLLMLAWAWFGRLFLGAGGWWLVILPIMAGPVILVVLIVHLVLTLATPRRPRVLTTAQVVAHFLLWAGLLGFGFFLVDGGDTEESVGSAFTANFGQRFEELSNALAVSSGVLVVLAWVGVIVTSILAWRNTPPAVPPMTPHQMGPSPMGPGPIPPGQFRGAR